jgi:hypothetical protein
MDEPVGFRPEITLTKNEALDVLAILTDAIAVAQVSGPLALAVELNDQAEMITGKLAW